jgi:RNA polymerase sigma-70 factor, ECF subfamily
VPASIHPNEHALVVRAQQGDGGALGELYQWYAPAVFRYLVIRVGDVVDAEDLTSEVFLRAQKALQRYDDRGVPFAAWLFRIAHDRMVDHYRSAALRQTARLSELLFDDRLGPEAQAISRREARELAPAVASLTDEQQMVIHLRFIEGYNLGDTALIMRKTIGATKALQHRALQSLAKKLKT